MEVTGEVETGETSAVVNGRPGRNTQELRATDG